MDPSEDKSKPFSLRLTFEERTRLERDAVGMTIGAYIRWRLFDPDRPPPRRRGKAPVKDYQALGAVLGKLGQSRLSSNLNQLARAAHTGSLLVGPETDLALQSAARDISEIRHLLIEALGLEA